MEIIYNGVHLELSTIERCHRELVMTPDHADALYVLWHIGVTAVFGAGGKPVGTSTVLQSAPVGYELNGFDTGLGGLSTNSGGAPRLAGGATNLLNNVPQEREARRRGFNAAMTDVELRYRLMLPRKKLKLTAYDDAGQEIVWLESPRGNDACCQIKGPIPVACDILEATGEGVGFAVYFEIETAVPLCPSGADFFVLSHRWQMTHDHDEDYYLTRSVAGEAYFNAAMVQTLGFNPDWVRSQLFHPIPLGFRRHLGPITLSSDSTVLQYEYHDTDPTVTFDPGDSGATKMEIIERVNFVRPHRFIPG